MKILSRRALSPSVSRTRRLTPVAAACATFGALGTLGVMPALAQQAPAAEPSQTIVVTGIRGSLETSLTLKRDSRGLVDGIVAEDIGKFPDTNLAESMQRIAGVSIDRAPSGEGSKVTVRGVGPDSNMVLLNGRQMPTSVISNENGGANGSRAFDFANLATDSIAAIEVYKTSRASMPTGGIGATINVKTARPLDVKGTVAAFGIKANHDTSNERLPDSFKGDTVTPEVAGIYSTVLADGKVGISISGSWSKRDSGSNKAYTQNGWRTFPANSGDWGTIPPAPASGPDPITNRPTGNTLYSTSVDLRYSVTALKRERTNGEAVLQFAPSKELKFTLNHTAVNNTIDKKNAENSSWFNFSFGPTTFTTGGPVVSPLIQTALFPNNDHDYAVNNGLYGEKTRMNSTGLNVEWKVSPALRVELDAHSSKSKTSPNSPYGTYSLMDLALFNQGNAIAYYDQKFPVLSLPTTTFDRNKLQLTGSQFVNNLSDQGVDQFQTSARWKLDDVNTLNAGLGFTRIKDRRASYNNQNNDWGGVGAQGDYANVATGISSLPGYFSAIPGSGDPRQFQQFYLFDFNSLRARSIEVLMATRGVTRAQAEAYFSASSDYTRGNDWRTNEDSSSVFLQWDRAFDRSNISVGLRYETTKVDASSQVVSRTSASWISQNEIALAAGPTTFGSATGKYSYFLPSIDWDMDVTDKVKLRASYGENIGRPGFESLVGGINVDANANAGGGQGSTGNANLKPLLSKNFDLSAEFYYAKSSYVAASAYYKKISNYVGTSSQTITQAGLTTPIGGAYYQAGLAACGGNTQPLCIRNFIFNNFNGQPGVNRTGVNASGEILGTIDGRPGDPALQFRITTPSNETTSTVKGLELNFQHIFAGTGFGVAGNYTFARTGLKYNDGSLATQSALPGVSDSANIVGFYEAGGWSVRLAYNWRDEFLAGKVDGAGNNPIYTEAYGQVDLSVGYKIGNHLTLQADLINLNDGYIRSHSRTTESLQSVIQTGRRYLIGARYKF
jgi:TonB-dependent receptor